MKILFYVFAFLSNGLSILGLGDLLQKGDKLGIGAFFVGLILIPIVLVQIAISVWCRVGWGPGIAAFILPFVLILNTLSKML
jgi:hypothetical protein